MRSESGRFRQCLSAAALVLPLIMPAPAHSASLSYPATAKTNQIDNYHGVKVSDPFRWLEDDNSAETKAWVQAENKLTFSFLEQIPERARIKERLTKLWTYERYGVPQKRGSRYFYTRNDGLQNQAVLYVADSLDADPRALLDPNELSKDGTVALSGTAVSDDGRLLAYGLSTSGSDWQEWRARDVGTGRDLPDLVQWVKFSGASWTKDGAGFYYSRYDEPTDRTRLTKANYYHKLYYHRLGSRQSADPLVYERPDHKDWNFSGNVTDDGQYLIITVSEGTDRRSRVYYQDLRKPGSEVVRLLDDFDAAYNFIDHDGTIFWFHTDLDGPRGRVVQIDISRPARPEWKEIIPQAAETLTSVGMVNDQFVAHYLKDARSLVKVFRRDGRLAREVSLPGLGSAGGFGGRRRDRETFYSFTSFTVPGTIYRYDLTTGASAVFRSPTLAFHPEDYETSQIFYLSKDGTKVPMFLSHRKGLKLNRQTPALLYGYGGFDISLPPRFSVGNLLWMEMGGIYAQPNLRGGGEYGEEWHQAGMKLRKQNVFDDFIAAAEWLIARQYTSTPKLAISGGSNGGLLVGACMTQRPDLYGACLPAVGVMDMLRFQKFTIGWAWTSDYGSSDNPEEFKALYAYSPYHRLKPGVKYPPALVTTADHDDRVVPAHSFKFAARLQECQAGDAPVLIRIETKAGHGAGKPTAKLIEEETDALGFLVRELHISF